MGAQWRKDRSTGRKAIAVCQAAPARPADGYGQAQRPALALRGTGDEPVIVEADGLTVFLKLEPRAGEPVLLGQLAGDDLEPWIGALVQVWQDGALRSTAEVDDRQLPV